jgi:hypothetical protein
MFFFRPLLHARTSIPIRFRPSISQQLVRWNSNVHPMCPSCSQPLPSSLLACPSCWSIFPLPANISHHQVFSLPDEPNPFVVDLSTLKSRFLRAQAACHPDAWASKTPVCIASILISFAGLDSVRRNNKIWLIYYRHDLMKHTKLCLTRFHAPSTFFSKTVFPCPSMIK